MTYKDFYNQIAAIGNDMLVAEDFVWKVYSTLEKFRLDKAAQHSVQADGGGCLLSSDRAVDGIRPRYKVDYGR